MPGEVGGEPVRAELPHRDVTGSRTDRDTMPPWSVDCDGAGPPARAGEPAHKLPGEGVPPAYGAIASTGSDEITAVAESGRAQSARVNVLAPQQHPCREVPNQMCPPPVIAARQDVERAIANG